MSAPKLSAQHRELGEIKIFADLEVVGGVSILMSRLTVPTRRFQFRVRVTTSRPSGEPGLDKNSSAEDLRVVVRGGHDES